MVLNWIGKTRSLPARLVLLAGMPLLCTLSRSQQSGQLVPLLDGHTLPDTEVALLETAILYTR